MGFAAKVLLLAPLALVLGGAVDAAGAGHAPSGQKAAERDPVERVRDFAQKHAGHERELPEDAVATIGPLVAELRMIQVSVADRRHEVFLALLDLASLHPVRPPEPARRMAFAPPTPREHLAGLAYEALGRALDLDSRGELTRWVATSVLAEPGLHGIGRRRAALDLYAGRREPAIQLALMACTLDPERAIRDAAMRALVGWPDDAVHRLMVMQLAKTRSTREWIDTERIREHFRNVALEPGSLGARTLFEFVRRDLLSEDWRDAVRALRLLRAVDDALAVPALIDSLAAWISRGEKIGGAKRIEDEIHRQLKDRSGKSIGPFPERWAQWWQTVRSGALPPKADEPRQATRASFFGLRPATDRVTFVIDRSGSMASSFAGGGATGGGTRYHEALRQMATFLAELGPKARFRIVMFDSELRIWKDRLAPATAANLASAEQWAGYQHPAGGTELRPAIEHVLRIGRDGKSDVRRVEEDTVIVLCDGATNDGASWIRPLLERVSDETCIVFHCVQIGGGSDGSLELLAELTGGQFIRTE